MSAPRTAETITVHDAIVEALDSVYDRESGAVHGQLCPVWVNRKRNPPVWDCNCWHLSRLLRMAEAVCRMLDGASA